METTAPDWSVVVIAHNEERHIGECLRSILVSLAGRSHEVILVDSASTDRTVEIARSFPVRILRLGRNLPLSPAAGRHAGFVKARGELILFMDGDSILFMDGDSILDPAWIEPALEALRDPSVEGVAGRRWQVSEANPDFEAPPRYQYAGSEKEFDSSPHPGGPALCETRPETFADLFRRVRLLFPCGMGQVIRHGLRSGRVTRRQALNFCRHLIAVFFVLAGLAAFSAYLLWGTRWPFGAWAVSTALIFTAFCVRARGFRKPLYYFVQWPLFGALALWGFLMPPRAAGEYPVPEDLPLPSPAPSSDRVPARAPGSTDPKRAQPSPPGAPSA